MTALDSCEPQITRALEKDGWQILDKPFPIRGIGGTALADFRMVWGERQVVVCEVKCFSNPKQDLQEFYTAVGQYRYYRAALNMYVDAELSLYLALPHDAYERFAERPAIYATFKESAVKLILIDIVEERVVQWLD